MAQLLYELCFCLWSVSLCEEARHDFMSCGAVPILAQQVFRSLNTKRPSKELACVRIAGMSLEPSVGVYARASSTMCKTWNAFPLESPAYFLKSEDSRDTCLTFTFTMTPVSSILWVLVGGVVGCGRHDGKGYPRFAGCSQAPHRGRGKLPTTLFLSLDFE